MYVFLGIIISYCLLYIIIPRKYIGWLFAAFVIAMSVMAYYSLPAEKDDLARYYGTLDTLREMSFLDFLDTFELSQTYWNGMPTCGFYFYFISKLPYNGFFPAITIFICYGSLCLMLYKAANRYNIGKWYLFLGSILMFITFAFHGVVSGIRNGLTGTVFCLCLFYELFEKKHNILCWIGYVACIGMHASGIIVFLLMLAEIPNRKNNQIYYTALVALGVALSSLILQFLGEVTNIAFFETMAYKENAYSTKEYEFGLGYYAKVIRFAVLLFYSAYGVKYIKNMKRYESIAAFMSFGFALMFYTTLVVANETYFSRVVGWPVPIMGSLMTMIGLASHHEVKLKEQVIKEKSIIKPLTVLDTNELLLNLALIASILLLGWVVFFKSSLCTYVVGRSL